MTTANMTLAAYLESIEGDPTHNDTQRGEIAAFYAQHGETWLVNVNLYRDEPGRVPLVKWDGESLIYNFGCSAYVPCHDAELERMILERQAASYTGTRDDAVRVAAIFDRIGAIGGKVAVWT